MIKIKNYSASPTDKIRNWLPHDLDAEEVIFFPDVCPGISPLPTGTVVFTRQDNWRKFAISDCGCGMMLCKSEIAVKDFKKKDWDNIYRDLKNQKGKLGDLGSGNHFLDTLESYSNDRIYFLIHTGSRNESNIVDHLIDKPNMFDSTFTEVCDWAFQNRTAIKEIIEKYFGKLEVIVDKNHNHFELVEGGVIIRKGAVKAEPGDLVVIPSNLDGDVVLARATENVGDVFNSLNHGTGRVMSRSEAKEHSSLYDYDDLRRRIYIPKEISNASIKTEAPFCYRELDECIYLIRDLIKEVERFSPFAYLGQI